MAFDSGGLGDLGWWDMASPDVIGGDGSDDDLQIIAQQCGEDAIRALYSECSNVGMQVLAAMIEPAVMAQVEGLPDGQEPSEDDLYDAIAGVHSPDTARSCMTAGIQMCIGILYQGLEVIRIHEAFEGETI